MITNNFNKELRGISDALRDLGYTDSTIGLRQRYWKEYCFFHGSLDIDEASMDEFLLKNYDIQSGNINVSKRQYLYKAGIEVTPEKNHGMHTLRHSLANELLRKEIPLPVISEILGHKSLETTMQYLRADTEQLRCCTLVEGENYAVTT